MKKLFLVLLTGSLVSFLYSSEEFPSATELFNGGITYGLVVPCVGVAEIIHAVGEENSVTECFPSSARKVVNGAMALGILSAAAFVVHDITGVSGEVATVGAAVLLSYCAGLRKWTSEETELVPH